MPGATLVASKQGGVFPDAKGDRLRVPTDQLAVDTLEWSVVIVATRVHEDET